MAGISNTGLGLPAATGLPSAASLFGNAAGAAPGTTAPAATTVAADPNSTQPGILVQGTSGSTALPSATPADFQGGNPTPLDQPHPQYPTLIASHVAVLQAVGTPEAVIQELANQQPQAEYLDRYIQGEIMQNPEGWDAYVGNPTGTARAGLAKVMPNAQIPAPGQGNAGYMPDGSPVSGINVPGLSTPMLDPTTGQPAGNSWLMPALAIGAAAIGGIFLWRHFKNKNAATDLAKQGVQALVGGGAAGEAAALGGGGGLNAIQTMGRQLMGAGVDANDLSLVQRGMSLGVFGGGAAGAGGGAAAAATAESIMNGMGAANGFLNTVGISTLQFGQEFQPMAQIALADRWMGVAEIAARTGQLADFAATQVAMKQALAGGSQVATTGVMNNATLRNLLASAANAIPV